MLRPHARQPRRPGVLEYLPSLARPAGTYFRRVLNWPRPASRLTAEVIHGNRERFQQGRGVIPRRFATPSPSSPAPHSHVPRTKV